MHLFSYAPIFQLIYSQTHHLCHDAKTHSCGFWCLEIWKKVRSGVAWGLTFITVSTMAKLVEGCVVRQAHHERGGVILLWLFMWTSVLDKSLFLLNYFLKVVPLDPAAVLTWKPVWWYFWNCFDHWRWTKVVGTHIACRFWGLSRSDVSVTEIMLGQH